MAIAERGSASPRFSGRVLVIQPRPGLGDLIWHLPLIRAIAGASDARQVTLLTKPSTQAATLLEHDATIERILWLERNPRGVDRRQGGRHDGPIGYARLLAYLRAAHADTAILLHHSPALAAALRLAGIPNRLAYGFSRAQRRWLNAGPYLPPMPAFTEAFAQADAFARALGFADLPEPSVAIDADAVAHAREAVQHLQQPLIAIGIGAHGAERQWGTARFAELARALLARGPGCVLLIGASHEAPLAREIAEAIGQPERVREIVGWELQDVAGVLLLAEMFVGNDSGLLNLRAALGKPAFGLFGASGPLLHSGLIRPIVAAGGARAGMGRIGVGQVLEAILS